MLCVLSEEWVRTWFSPRKSKTLTGLLDAHFSQLSKTDEIFLSTVSRCTHCPHFPEAFNFGHTLRVFPMAFCNRTIVLSLRRQKSLGGWFSVLTAKELLIEVFLDR